MGKRALCVVIIAGMLLAAGAAYGQKGTGAGDMHVFSGNVTSIDWPSSKITVTYRDPDTGIIESITLLVTEETVFRRESEDMSFSDVEVQDQVQIEYRGDFMNNPVLVVLNDMNTEND
jgi:hypothetical protein